MFLLFTLTHVVAASVPLCFYLLHMVQVNNLELFKFIVYKSYWIVKSWNW